MLFCSMTGTCGGSIEKRTLMAPICMLHCHAQDMSRCRSKDTSSAPVAQAPGHRAGLTCRTSSSNTGSAQGREGSDARLSLMLVRRLVASRLACQDPVPEERRLGLPVPEEGRLGLPAPAKGLMKEGMSAPTSCGLPTPLGPKGTAAAPASDCRP